MKTIPYILSVLMYVIIGMLTACSSKADEPANFTEVGQAASIYPDYKDIIIPPNIAPLNFLVRTPGEKFVAVLTSSEGKKLSAYASHGSTLQFNAEQWKSLLSVSRGKEIQVQVYTYTEKKWLRFQPFTWHVAKEEIDPFVSYRLIEPGYSYYRQLGLYQRNLTNFQEEVIYENNRTFDYEDNHCINCHNYQNYSTQKMLFHVRTNHSGTILAQGKTIEKINFQHDSIPFGAVYPAWHPTQNWILFSSNKTGQAFHILNEEKVEVIDMASDLLFYDANQKEVKYICHTDSLLETFPCWSPAGDKIYYCVGSLYDHQSTGTVRPKDFNTLRYNIVSRTFQSSDQSFGEEVTEINCDSIGISASVPRISPDGRYLLFTAGSYGQFHIWHKSADLYVKDLEADSVYPLQEANSTDADSYHCWSSNGRWIVFSSRRDDGSYTRLYITYFNPKGKASKAFILPQQDPEHNMKRLKSYNVPELTRDQVQISPQQFQQTIYQTKGSPITYKND